MHRSTVLDQSITNQQSGMAMSGMARNVDSSARKITSRKIITQSPEKVERVVNRQYAFTVVRESRIHPDQAGSYQRPSHQSIQEEEGCLLYTSPSPRDLSTSRMPSSA